MLLLAATALYAGSASCSPCHAAIAEAYARTAMARSSGTVVDAPPAGRFRAAGQDYEVAGRRLEFAAGSAGLDYFIGSNTAGRSFLTVREGYLYELPVTWYTRQQKWDASPGYEKDTWVRLNRAVEPGCLGCHASRVRPIHGTQNRYGDPPFLDDGVSCERCHGPGSEHVRDPAAARMVNPAKVDAERRDSVCSQCHLTGEVRVSRAGTQFAAFQAGELLRDYATYFVRPGPGLKVTSHVERLAASKCRRASGDALWCGTCHDVHTGADRTQQACLGCHSAAHRRSERCADCHMPRTATSDGSHGAMTDHGIERRPGERAERSVLTAFLGTADDRAWGIAYAETGSPLAREYLSRSQPADAAVLLRLAVLEPDRVRAARLYEAALRSEPAQVTALVNLGAIYAQQDRTPAAVKLWERALEANPAIEEAVLNLARVLKPDTAHTLLRRYLQFNPGSPAARLGVR
ncbi:MAG: hypothetical protein KGN36_14680 [Acidobacteriota bacterium]|nr:hypothetical protein [Acidobacteriota bacterium]